MLKMLPEWSDAVIVRTRDPAELAKCEAVVDVGGVYDAETLRCGGQEAFLVGRWEGGEGLLVCCLPLLTVVT